MASAGYEMLYNLAVEEYQSAHSEILNRLFCWAGIDPQYTDCTKSAKRLKRNESILLSDTTAVQAIICQFHKDIGVKEQQDYGIRGWECGMCQILDLTKDSVCKILPFLLCAYLYNFPFNKFVQCYIREVGITKALEYSFSGIENAEEAVGIGKLLRGEVTNLARIRMDIFRLADRFQFPETVTYEPYADLLSYSGSKRTYILPSNLSVDKFKRNCLITLPMTKGKIDYTVPWVAPVTAKGYERYRKWIIYTFFYVFYVGISNCAEEYPDHFAAKPDPALCWFLLTNDLQDNKWIEMTKSSVEALSYNDAVKAIDIGIRERLNPAYHHYYENPNWDEI